MPSGRLRSQGENRRKRLIPNRIPRRRLARKNLLAEIIEDRRTRPPTFHMLIQRQGSAEILTWGQFRTLKEARQAVEEFFNETTPPEQTDAA